MTILYDVAFIMFSIAYLPYMLLTGRWHKDMAQRFGVYPKESLDKMAGGGNIWLHAVSVGEVMAAGTLVEGLLKKYPEKKIVISTTTKTGNDIARKRFGDRAVIIYFPADISFVVKKALKAIKPKALIIIETEIWPNVITALNKMSVPVIIVNGRISPRSFKGYMRIRPVIKGVLKNVELFCMQGREYADRIRSMGAPPERVIVTGNMKFDAAARTYASGSLDVDAIKNDLNIKDGETLFIAGSTHKPEEEMIMNVYNELLGSVPGLRLLIAPRHVERTTEIEGVVRKMGFSPARISMQTRQTMRAPDAQRSVLILDTIGRLSRIFSAGTIVFIGGSLMPRGGQNILEPAIFSKPILFGPHMFNFKDITETFLNREAARMVKSADQLREASSDLLTDPEKRRELGERAKKIVDENMGATERNIDKISEKL
jgi:3-deoxy-D-manno-octulosonic-acid transferase